MWHGLYFAVTVIEAHTISMEMAILYICHIKPWLVCHLFIVKYKRLANNLLSNALCIKPCNNSITQTLSERKQMQFTCKLLNQSMQIHWTFWLHVKRSPAGCTETRENEQTAGSVAAVPLIYINGNTARNNT